MRVLPCYCIICKIKKKAFKGDYYDLYKLSVSIWERKSTKVHLISVFNVVIQISYLFHEAVWLSKKAEDTSNLSSDEFENDLKSRKFRKRKSVPLPGEEMTQSPARMSRNIPQTLTQQKRNKTPIISHTCSTTIQDTQKPNFILLLLLIKL